MNLILLIEEQCFLAGMLEIADLSWTGGLLLIKQTGSSVLLKVIGSGVERFPWSLLESCV